MAIVYPGQIDNSVSLPPAVDTITPIQSSVFNLLRDAIIALESELGTKPSGTYGTVKARLDALSTGGGGGGIQLGQDLGGTNIAPLVIGLQGKRVSSVAPSDGWVLTWNASLSHWEAAPGAAVPSQITAFISSTTTREVGQSIVQPSFTATYNFTPTSVILTDNNGSPSKDVTSTSGSFHSDGTFSKNTFNASVVFTLTAQPGSATKTATISWGQKNYFGIGTAGANVPVIRILMLPQL